MLAKILEYLSRKFLLSLLALVGTFVLAWYSKDLLGWAAAMSPILAFYSGSNIYQEYLASKRGATSKED